MHNIFHNGNQYPIAASYL